MIPAVRNLVRNGSARKDLVRKDLMSKRAASSDFDKSVILFN